MKKPYFCSDYIYLGNKYIIKGRQKISSGSLTLTYTPGNTFTYLPNKFSFKKWNKTALWNLANQLFGKRDRKILVL